MTLSKLTKNLIAGGVALIGLSLLAPASAFAATFGFSFQNVEGAVSGTVTGTIELPDASLTTDGNYAATAITITSAPIASLGFPSLPIDVFTTFPTILVNSFNLVGGIIQSTSSFGAADSGFNNAFTLNQSTFGTNLDGPTPGVAVVDANSQTLTYTSPGSSEQVPEPGTILGLLAVGALGLVSRKREG